MMCGVRADSWFWLRQVSASRTASQGAGRAVTVVARCGLVVAWGGL